MRFIRNKTKKTKNSERQDPQLITSLKSSDRHTSANMEFELEPIRLVEGKFNAINAADVLISLLNDKIRYHTIKPMNISVDKTVRNRSVLRIVELKQSKNKILELIVRGSKMGKWVEIDSAIHIKLIEKPSEPMEGPKQNYGLTSTGG